MPMAMASDDNAPTGNGRRNRCHRLRLVTVNDVYAFDDVDSPDGNPRGGWSRAATLMKRLRNEVCAASEGDDDPSAARHHDDDDDDSDGAAKDTTTVLTVVNGDVLGGSSLLESCRGSVAIEIMNSIPVDAAVLGNHEFDYGDVVLAGRIGESSFPWLGSNVYYNNPPRSPLRADSTTVATTPTPRSTLQQEQESFAVGGADAPESPSSSREGLHYFPGVRGDGVIYDLGGSTTNLKLGVFGMVTKSTPFISSPGDDVAFDGDVLAVARRVTRRLRERGADVIVAVTHMSEGEDRLLAADGVSGVDAVLGGHEHEPLAAMVHRNDDDDDDDKDGGASSGRDGGGEANAMRNEGGVLVFKCGMNAYWVGAVDLDIHTTTTDGMNPEVSRISTSWAMHAVSSDVEEDSAISAIVKKRRREADERILASAFGEEVSSTVSLDEALSTVGGNADLDTRMSSVRRREATGGNLIADAMAWLLRTTMRNASTLPMLAMINGGFIRGDRRYKPGSIITVREVLTELPFPRVMKVLEMRGSDLKEALAQQLSHPTPSGAYPHLSSNAKVSYKIGSNGLASIHSLSVDGLEVSDAQKYLIGVTCFVADGNEGCKSWLKGIRIENPAWEGRNVSYVLLKYLQSHSVIYPALEDRCIRVTI